MDECKSVGVRTFDSFKWVLLIMMISLFSFFSFGCCKGKWIDGDGIVGGELSISFVKDGEVISVSSSHMPDNGMEAFHAVRKVLGEAWSQGK